jgi:hypothetical protein
MLYYQLAEQVIDVRSISQGWWSGSGGTTLQSRPWLCNQIKHVIVYDV